MPSKATPIIYSSLSTRSLPCILDGKSGERLAQLVNGMEATIILSKLLASASCGPRRHWDKSVPVMLSALSLEICTKHLPIRQSNCYYQDEACRVIC